MNTSNLHKFILSLVFLSVATAARGTGEIKSSQFKYLAYPKQTFVALMLYAEDHQGKLPNSLKELIPNYCPDDKIFAGIYLLQPGGTVLSTLPPTAPVLVLAPPIAQGRAIVVVHADCSGRVTLPEFPPSPIPAHRDPWRLIEVVIGLSGWAAAFFAWVRLRRKQKTAEQ